MSQAEADVLFVARKVAEQTLVDFNRNLSAICEQVTRAAGSHHADLAESVLPDVRGPALAGLRELLEEEERRNFEFLRNQPPRRTK